MGDDIAKLNRRRRILILWAVAAVFVVVACTVVVCDIQRKKAVVMSLRSAGATVLFDYQVKRLDKPEGIPGWLHSVLGDYLLADVELVSFTFTAKATDTAVVPLSDLTKLKHVALYGVGVTDLTATMLSGIQTLESLSLINTSVTASGLRELGSCPHLESLTLSGAGVTDTVIEGVDQWPSLKKNQIIRASISSRGLVPLSKSGSLIGIDLWEAGRIDDSTMTILESFTGLESLHIVNAPISDSGLQSCSAWKSLRLLQINSPAITDVGLENLRHCRQLKTVGFQEAAVVNPAVLAALPQLRVADLSGTKLIDNSVQWIAKSKSIRSLSLQRAGLSDDGILQLSCLGTLRDLTVGPDISEQGASALQLALPACKIQGIDQDGIFSWTLLPK